MYDERAQVITDAVKKFGITACPRQFNPQALGNVTPYYSWQIDPSKLNITGREIMQRLADTRPIGIGSMGAGASGMRGRDPETAKPTPAEPNPAASAGPKATPATSDTRAAHHRPARDPRTFGFAVWQLKEGEDKLIANRLVEILSAAPKA